MSGTKLGNEIIFGAGALLGLVAAALCAKFVLTCRAKPYSSAEAREVWVCCWRTSLLRGGPSRHLRQGP